MQLWYVCKENQLFGPFQEGDLLASIEQKKIQAQDWVRTAEQVEWQIAGEVESLKDHFSASLSASSGSEKLPFEENWQEKWVLLQLDATTNSYNQLGPYTTAEILSKIYKGSAEYTDFVWQQGMSEWKRLGTVKEFIPQEEELTQTKISVNMVEVNRESIETQVLVNKPAVDTFYQQLPLFEEEKAVAAKPAARLTKPVSEFPQYYKPVVNKKRRWWLFSFFCFILSLAIAIWGKNSLSLYL